MGQQAGGVGLYLRGTWGLRLRGLLQQPTMARLRTVRALE